MSAITICPECGVAQPEGKTCQDNFYQMLYWEAEDMALGRVHHLMVLCYHLQHASLYSPEGLQHGRGLLHSFVIDGVSPAEMRSIQKDAVDSGKRKWKIKGNITPGSWDKPVHWTMTAADVVAGGMAGYCDNVELWAKSVYDSLHEAFGDLK
jgi:hypothetical protein